MDSGCGHYLTGDESKFSNFHKYNGRDVIVIADNTVYQVEREDTVVINENKEDSITLNSVLRVPGMRKNLFFVANAIDAGSYLLFGPHDVKFF